MGVRIGLADQEGEGAFTWVDGESVAYTNWAPGEPSYGMERYVHMVLPGQPHSGRWNNIEDMAYLVDGDQTVTFQGVVEIPQSIFRT